MPTVTIPEMNREVFETVVKSIYDDPKKASIREIVANAVDANREVVRKNQEPEKVIVTLDYDSVVVRDYGTGMSPDTIRDIYGSMYQSTKRSPYKDGVTSANGEHGIGSKAPYGYLYKTEDTAEDNVKYYIVRTIYNSVEYTYTMFLNEHGIPSYDLLCERETSEKSGTEVTLPFSYMNLGSNQNNIDIGKLITVLIPFCLESFGSLIDIRGNSQSVIDTINSVASTAMRFNNLYFVEYGPTFSKNIKSSIDIKYKNIIYPNDDFYCSLNRSGSTLHVFYDINLDELDAPLVANRSRDRIDWKDNAQNLDISGKIEEDVEALVQSMKEFFRHLINSNKISSTVKFNAIIKTIKRLVMDNSTKSLYTDIDSLIKKRIASKGVQKKINHDMSMGEKELILWKDILKITDKEFDDALLISGVPDIEFVYMFITSFRYFNFVTEDMFETKDSPALRTLDRYLGAKMKKIEIYGGNVDEITVEGTSTFMAKQLPLLMVDESVGFVVRDSRSFKVEAAHLIADENNEICTVYHIDPYQGVSPDSIIADFVTDGINRAYKSSDVYKKYKTEIDEYRKEKKQNSQTGIKRVKGVIGLIQKFEHSTRNHKQPERKTIPSDVIEDVANITTDLYVLKKSEDIMTGFTKDSSFVDASICYEYERYGYYHYECNMMLKCNNIQYRCDMDDMGVLIPSHSTLLIVEDAHYDNVMEYFDEFEPKSYFDEIRAFISSMDLNVYAKPNMVDLNGEIENIYHDPKSILTASSDDRTNSGAIKAVKHLVSMSSDFYKFKDFGHPMDEFKETLNGLQLRIFREFCVYHKSDELKELAVQLFEKFLENSIARTIVRDINMYSVKSNDSEYREFFDYVVDLTDTNFFIEKYLTNKK